MKLIIDITDDQYKAVQDGVWCGSLYEELKNGIPVEPCEDCISREKVSELLNEGWWKGIYPKKAIMALPSVKPMPKMGKWEWIIDVSEETPVSPEEIEYDGWGCSICHNPPDDTCDWDDPNDPPTHKYCPNCGVKMENEI